jgi:serine/threonine protein kinase
MPHMGGTSIDWEAPAAAMPCVPLNGQPAYSPYYAPPELVVADPPERSGVTTDLYQATALLYELVTGLPPYHWEVRSGGACFERLVLDSPDGPLLASAVNPSLPRDLDELLAAGLAPLPERRPGSAHELLERLPGLARRHGDLPIRFAALRGRGLATASDTADPAWAVRAEQAARRPARVRGRG